MFRSVVAVENDLEFSEENVAQTNLTAKVSVHNHLIGSYISCIHDDEWFTGIVEDVSVEFNHFLIKFLFSKGPLA